MSIFGEGKGNHASDYKLDLYFRPRGQCNDQYLSGFADCMCAALKVGGEAKSRQFKKLPGGILHCALQMSDEVDGEAETTQWIVDVIEKASLNQQDVEIAVDGKKITLVVER